MIVHIQVVRQCIATICNQVLRLINLVAIKRIITVMVDYRLFGFGFGSMLLN